MNSKPSVKMILFWDVLIPVILTLIIVKFVLTMIYVPTSSMEPTINANSYHLAYMLPYKLGDPMPEKGSIIIFDNAEKEKVLVKRVIATEGETVTFENGDVYVDGNRLEEPYLNGEKTLSSGNSESYTVPEGCVFVMGDNRQHSVDSRYMKNPFISTSDIIGVYLR